MTVREMIYELLNYDMDREIKVSCNYSAEKAKKLDCKGAIFDIEKIEPFGSPVTIIFKDWREDDE